MDRKKIVDELIQLIKTGNAHVPFDDAIDRLPKELRVRTPEGLPYNVWQLVEHIRIAQWDIVEFCISADHRSPAWPSGYWPAEAGNDIDDETWMASIQQIRADRQRFIDLLSDASQDLLKPLDHGTGQSLFREALLIADHAAYHTGQIIAVRRLLDNWEE